MKKYICLILILVLVLSCCQFTYADNGEITVLLDGGVVNFDGQQPVMVNDRIMLPIRSLIETMGGSVGWDESGNTAIISRNIPDDIVQTVYVTQNSSIVTYDCIVVEQKVTMNFEMDVPAQVINDKMMMPLRYAASIMNYCVTWSDSNQTAYIESPYQAAVGEYYLDTNVPVFNTTTSNSLGYLYEASISISGNFLDCEYSYDEETKAEDAFLAYVQYLVASGWADISDSRSSQIKKFSKDGQLVYCYLDLNTPKDFYGTYVLTRHSTVRISIMLY